ncbi:hypothetical protein [Heliorestis convoluta]|uniref:Uncharacterized protein n=1 Tax=Heliorestis convoluta TaxID=356322 RepID=A0A5Q2N1J9_9FIRM|nr:hypothetical protein [Heliorestis convoluta]QGG47699.1 hypothetical protein FTV88_1599 [Heliorestis convoluta]
MIISETESMAKKFIEWISLQLKFNQKLRADFEVRIYSAIVSYPEKEDLWEQFETICRNPEKENRLEEAMNFYKSHQSEMDQGVEVLWPGRFSYARLMIEKVNIGSRVFRQARWVKMNEAIPSFE